MADRETQSYETSCVVASSDKRVLWVSAGLFVVLMALSPWYGFDRDELYFLDCARHLQASYVDQPIFTPLLARGSLALFGVSLPGLRLWPAIAGALTVVVAGLTARELGGGRRVQLLAAVATATMPSLLAIDHLTGPTAFDMLAWAALALVLLHIERTHRLHWWLAAGVVLGLGLANKHSIGFFALALVLSMVLVRDGRRLVLNRWFLGGALIAASFTVPDLWWQSTHGWATIAMTRQLNADNGGAGAIPTWVVGQLLMTALALVPVWAIGLRWLWRSDRPVRRGIAVAYALLFVFFAVTTGSKIYYLAGAYIPLLAAGMVALADWLDKRGHLRTLALGVAISAAAALPIVLPVLPAADTAWSYGVNQVPGESVGWPELVHKVDVAWRHLPRSLRKRAVIVTQDYGEAGAINELGRGTGLPVAFGDQNTDWWWGPRKANIKVVVSVAPGPRDVTSYRAYLLRFFRSVTVIATLRNTAGLHNQEWGGHVYLCRHLRRPWPVTWRLLRHYD
jgi:4-amino-4-deoxy-L-arabinose transferase-like glycosyltransferase